MAEIDLLRSLPKAKRNIAKRAAAKDPTVVAVARQYGEMYWDGPRDYGYGGYPAYYGSYYGGDCPYVYRTVMTPWGWRRRLTQICY